MDSIIKDADAVIILTAHSEYFKLNPADTKVLMGKYQPVVVDGRNVIDPAGFVESGFVYKGIGRGDVN